MGSERWSVGDPIGCGNDIGAPEVPYMSYGPRSVNDESESERAEAEEELEIQRRKYKSKQLSKEAWSLCEEGRYDEALVFINRALEYCDRLNENWNIKGIILDDLKRYDEAVSCYDKSIGLGASDTVRHNKAVCLINYCYRLKDDGNDEAGLSKIEDALEIFQEIDNKESEHEAWNLKGLFLDRMDDIAQAFNCYKRAFELAGDDSDMKKTYMDNRDKLLTYIKNTEVNCPGCGKKVNIADARCDECGTPIDESVEIILKDNFNSMEDREITHEYDCGATILHFDED